MNIILAEQEEIRDNSLVLTDHRAKHIIKVLGSKVGESVRCGIINGARGEASIVSVNSKYPFRVELQLHLWDTPRVQSSIDLLLALPRPIMLKRIFRQAASLGVGTIFITHARRVEKSFWDATLLEPSHYKEHLVHGLEQAIDTVLPTVTFSRRFKPLVEKLLPKCRRNYTHLLLAHPKYPETLSQVLVEKPGRILLAVGPEGGWVEYEIERLRDCGFSPFAFGDRILKVDTAVVSLHGAISSAIEYLS